MLTDLLGGKKTINEINKSEKSIPRRYSRHSSASQE